MEQAGFRPNRSCADQVLSLTTYIEAEFQRKLETSATFIDLTAAYDIVWLEGMMLEIPCKTSMRLIDKILNNRAIQVVMKNSISRSRKLCNGLHQGSVLAPLLFSLYVADMPETSSRKFGYADDGIIATQCNPSSLPNKP